MATLSISKAAKEWGMHRATLYSDIDKGRVTAGLNNRGHKVVDSAEMLRVYGEPGVDVSDDKIRQEKPTVNDSDKSTVTALIDELKAEREALKKVNEAYESSLERERALSAELLAAKQEQIDLMQRLLPGPNTEKKRWWQIWK